MTHLVTPLPPVADQTSKNFLPVEHKTERWTYFSPNLSLTHALASKMEGTIDTIAITIPGAFLAIAEIFVLIPLKVTLGNVVIWLANKCLPSSVQNKISDSRSPDEVLPAEAVSPVDELVSSSVPKHLGRVDIEMRKDSDSSQPVFTIHMYPPKGKEDEYKTFVENGNEFYRQLAEQSNNQSNAKPGDSNYADPSRKHYVLGTSEQDQPGMTEIHQETGFLGSAKIELKELISQDGTRHVFQQRIMPNPSDENSKGEVQESEISLILDQLINGSLINRAKPVLAKSAPEVEKSTFQKMTHLAVRVGMAAGASILAYKTMEFSGYSSNWLMIPASLSAAYPVVVKSEKSLTQGGKIAMLEGLGMANFAAIHKATGMMGFNDHWFSYLLLTAPFTMMNTLGALSQPSLKKSVESTLKTTAAFATAAGSFTALKSMNVGTPILYGMALGSIGQAQQVLNAPTWTDTFKEIGKAGLAVSAGLGTRQLLNYTGLGESELATSMIAMMAYSAVNGAAHAKDWNEAAETAGMGVLAVGMGSLAHKVYSFAGTPIQNCYDSAPQCPIDTGDQCLNMSHPSNIFSNMAFSKIVCEDSYLNPQVSVMTVTPIIAAKDQSITESTKKVAMSLLLGAGGYAGLNFAFEAAKSAGYPIPNAQFTLEALLQLYTFSQLYTQMSGTYEQIGERLQVAYDNWNEKNG